MAHHALVLHFVIGLASCLLATVFATGFSYNGFKQYRLVPTSAEAVSKIHWLDGEFPPEPNPNAGLTFLTLPSDRKFENVDLLVPPALEPVFLATVRSTPGLRVHLVHRNYGRLVDQFDRQNRRSRRRVNRRSKRQAEKGSSGSNLILRHDYYRSFSEIRRALDQLNAKCNRLMRDTCQLISIGKTYLNNDLTVLRISKKPPTGNKTKVWLDGGIHAREWVSHAVAMYIADELISSLASNASLSASILDNHDVILLPMYNPDGYEYSRLRNRMWRKNREPTSHRSCRGVDLNRNYGYLWGGNASNKFACATNYRGPGAFSALETSAVKRFLESEMPGLVLFLSFHAYGQYVLVPYGYKKRTYSTTNQANMNCAAKLAIYSMLRVNNNFYTYGTGSDLLYEANGGSDDWAHGAARIPYSYTIELPDEGTYGFLLPASFVPEVGLEVTTGLRSLLEAIRRLEAGDPEMKLDCSIAEA